MDITSALRDSGFKPEASTDREWKPLKGRYATNWVTLRPETDDKGQKYYQAEWKVTETLDGATPNPSKYPEFKRRYYMVDGERSSAQDNLKALLNATFTAGVELDTSSDEALETSFANVIGVRCYIRAWGWQGDDGVTRQSFVLQKEVVAQKKKKGPAVPF